MNESKILEALQKEYFDDVFFYLEQIFGEDDVHEYIILPNIKRVKEALRDLHFTTFANGEKWVLAKVKDEPKANFELCDYLEMNELLPFEGHHYTFTEFKNLDN